LSNAIVAARDAGIIVVASAGNNGANVDNAPRYPACYAIDNIVSVAYTTRNDGLGSLSNYGATNVDLAAPGDQIYSTFAASDSYYWPPSSSFNLAGTSFAAGYVSGAFALVQARFPGENYRQTIARVFNSVDLLPSLSGKCITGGRLNLRKALSPPLSGFANAKDNSLHFSCGPNRTCVVEGSDNLITWIPLQTNTTSDSWSFDFTNPFTNAPAQFYRLVSQP
jgi:subtilisin family serine protease